MFQGTDVLLSTPSVVSNFRVCPMEMSWVIRVPAWRIQEPNSRWHRTDLRHTQTAWTILTNSSEYQTVWNRSCKPLSNTIVAWRTVAKNHHESLVTDESQRINGCWWIYQFLVSNGWNTQLLHAMTPESDHTSIKVWFTLHQFAAKRMQDDRLRLGENSSIFIVVFLPSAATGWS